LKKPAKAAGDSDDDSEDETTYYEEEAKKPKILKRPTAALKRPAAAMLKPTGVDFVCKKADKKHYASKESFACAIRTKAKRVAAAKKLKPADAKAFMSVAYRAATSSWDKA